MTDTTKYKVVSSCQPPEEEYNKFIDRKEYLKYADGLWMETDKPNLNDAERLSKLLRFANQHNKFLAYNLSPSFNWSAFGYDDQSLREFG